MSSISKKQSSKKNEPAQIGRSELVSFLDKTLDTSKIRDVSCNGLQVEGAEIVHRVALAVDACMEAYRRAVKTGCTMLITHHGIIWDGLRSIRGSARAHILYLLEHNLNLYASHLPLDLHPVLGNNASLAALLKLRSTVPFGLYKGVMIGFQGELSRPRSLQEISNVLMKNLDCEVTVLPFGASKIKRIAIVSGGGAGELPEAISCGVDLYITGEPSHENYHAALEAKINVLYCGHYHTEKAGVQALGRLITQKFGIETLFLDIPTPL